MDYNVKTVESAVQMLNIQHVPLMKKFMASYQSAICVLIASVKEPWIFKFVGM